MKDFLKQLKVKVSVATTAGIKKINEDAINHYLPEQSFELASKGIAFALADGVSSAEAGKEASHTAVQQFIEEYYQTPESWSVSQAGQKLLTTINLNLYKKSHQFTSDLKGFLCTFSALVLRSNIAHFFHVGDSRIYHIRDGKMQQITTDHVAILGKDPTLARALGMDSSLHIDYCQLTLQEGDRFVLSSDGIHDFIADQDIQAFAENEQTDAAQQLIEQALSVGSDDNISCQIIKIECLPEQDDADLNSQLNDLPLPPLLEVGDVLDDYQVLEVLFHSRRTHVYKVLDTISQQVWVLKAASEECAQDKHYIDRFIQEEWAASRIKNPNIVAIPTQSRHRNYLYYLMEYLPGLRLDQWMIDNPVPSPKKSIKIVKQIAAALQALHEKETLHHDLKPGNVIIDDELNIKIVGFGAVYISGVAGMYGLDEDRDKQLYNYIDPQMLLGKNSGIQRDVYALGVITYQLFTRSFPYGEAYLHCKNQADIDRLTYIRATDINPRIPKWFDKALEKSVSLTLDERYYTTDAFIADLVQPNPSFVWQEVKGEVDKSKLLFWQILSGFWLLMLVVFISSFS